MAITFSLIVGKQTKKPGEERKGGWNYLSAPEGRSGGAPASLLSVCLRA